MTDIETAIGSSEEHVACPTVLLVDDDSRLLRGLERHLNEEDFQVLTAVSPAEAYVVLSQDNVDLVVSDNMMTGILGTEFLKTVHTEHPQIKLMLLSGYVSDGTAELMISGHGIAKVLIKPCDARTVANAIREVLSDSDSATL